MKRSIKIAATTAAAVSSAMLVKKAKENKVEEVVKSEEEIIKKIDMLSYHNIILSPRPAPWHPAQTRTPPHSRSF